MLLDRLLTLQDQISRAKKLLKIEELIVEKEKLAGEMNQPDFWNDSTRAKKIAEEYQNLKTEVETWLVLEKKTNDLEELAKSGDESLAPEIEENIAVLETEYAHEERQLLLGGPYDKNNAIVAIHAGSGGTEAQDWAEMLLRMLLRFCENQGWVTKIIDESHGAEAGYKSIMFTVSGRLSYGYLKSEHGVHRLVRISPFDAEKMRHTSFASIEVLPEVNDKVEINLNPNDLRIDTFMSGGKGGQSVNTTYSAVRIVHVPTGITVSCQNERSQQQNKETALKVLTAKLCLLAEEKRAKERLELRGEFKSAEWGNQIRSYVLHPYHLVKDHRTGFESTNPEAVLEGDVLPLSEAYLRWIKE